MADELFVLIDDLLAGLVTRSRGSLRFVYDEAYRSRPHPTPLSVSMPLEATQYPDQIVTPWLAGLLPDNEAVVARWARTFQVATSPFGLLGTPIGEDCAGAVRFVTEDRLESALSRKGDVRWLDEAGVAQRLRDLKRDETSWLGADFTGRFSLAGAQAKTALLYDAGRWGVPSGSAATTHILKPAIAGLDDHDLNEHLCLRAAGRAGLLVANTRIETFEDQSVIVADRYDRIPSPRGWMRRIHQEDVCQALGVPPDRKYQNDGGPAPNGVVDLFRRVLPEAEAEAAVLRFCDALTLNWLICGTDAHAKNYSLLLAGRQVRLAPLYDIASALPYPHMPLQKLRLAMRFGGSYLVTARAPGMWAHVAKELGLSHDVVIDRAGRLMDRLPDAFADVAREVSVANIESKLPSTLVDAVTRRIADSRVTLDGVAMIGRRSQVEVGDRAAAKFLRVADLVPGQVISMPESGLAPAVIDAISAPVGGSRIIELIDLETGEALGPTHVLGSRRMVRVHPVTVEHHTYQNIGDDALDVHLGNQLIRVAPGESVHYTGKARPDVFRSSEWAHHTEPIAVGRGER